MGNITKANSYTYFSHFQRFKSDPKLWEVYQKHKKFLEKDEDSLDYFKSKDPHLILALVSMIAFDCSNRQSYRLGVNLCRHFIQTKLPKLPLKDLRTPFPSFFVQVPKELGFYTGFDPESPNDWIYGAYVTDLRDVRINVRIECGEKKEKVDELFICFFVLRDEKVVELDQVSAVLLDKTVSDLEQLLHGQDEITQKLYRIILNLVLYLNAAEQDLQIVEKPDEKRIRELEERIKLTPIRKERIHRKLTQKLQNWQSKETITYVAQKLEEDAVLYEKEEDVVPSGITKRRHLVAGHWNYYWCANRDTEGKIIRDVEGKAVGKHIESRWILPHWRGSDVALSLRKYYVVQHPEGEGDI